MKIRVCYCVASLCNEGPVNVMYNIIKNIDFTQFEVSIITLIPEKKTSRLVDFRKLPLEIIQINPDGYLKLIQTYTEFKKTIKRLDPNIIHSHCPRSLFFMYILKSKIKKVLTVHIYPGLQIQIIYGKMIGQMIIYLYKYCIKRIDLPIACADNVQMELKIKDSLNTASIPNGSNYSVWTYNKNEKMDIRRKLKLKDNFKYFIFIGRFSSEKQPLFLVDIFKNISADIGLIMLGDGVLWEEISKQKNANIILPGFVDNVYEYLVAADYYISCSKVEGLANTLLESMAVGLPVLLSNIPSHLEVLKKEDKTIGLSFDNTKDDLLLKINSIQNYCYEEISGNVKSLYEKYYTATEMSSQYQKEYIKLVS